MTLDDMTVYVFVRQDISPEQQIVQSAHAVFEMSKYAEFDRQGTPSLVVVGMPNVKALERVVRKLDQHGICYSTWTEPDFDFGFTAIATEPLSDEDKRPLANYRLWRYVGGASQEAHTLAILSERLQVQALPSAPASMPNKPEHCYTSGCPLAERGQGFVLGCGDPHTAKIAVILEAPGRDEISFQLAPDANRMFYAEKKECENEIALRSRDYPDVPVSMLTRGVPVVGKSGIELSMWVLNAVGLKREELFIDNTLRCLPPKAKNGEAYPIGDDRKKAEQCCRHYDRLHRFRPGAYVITLHPAGILREVTPLPLQIKDFEKARDFSALGIKTMLLAGGKAAHAFARHGSNVSKWRGDYALLDDEWPEKYVEDFEFTASARKRGKMRAVRDELLGPVKKRRKKKETVTA